MASKSINIISVPSDLGSVYAGKSRAPAALKTAGLQEKLKIGGWHVTEFAALPEGSGVWTANTREPHGARNETAIVEACNQVRHAVSAALANENGTKNALPFQLILSGECLFCPAILSAYWQHLEGSGKRIGIIYVDADCDLSTPTEAGSTGNIAGMTLTHLTLRDGGLQSMKAFSRPDGSGVVDSSNIVLYGLNVDSPVPTRQHFGYLLDNGFRVFTSQKVRGAASEQAAAALKWMEERVDFILVHLDVDVIDPQEFPLGNVPNWTGLVFEEVMDGLKVFMSSKKAVGLSVAEVNPDHDPGLKMTTRLVNEVSSCLEGIMRHHNNLD
ncbi:Arginase/deacetylase [Stipitochalara longipes BDJ]|nr:Arginase/deacetylase [Stipitochalara longipes BDJ]